MALEENLRHDEYMRWGHLPRRYCQWLGAAGLVLLAVTTWWMLANGTRGTNYAVVLTFAVAVLTLVVAVVGVPWQVPSDVTNYGVRPV
jgi:hypothetical protein